MSIVIPVYNGHNYVDQAISSALAQTYRNCEIIVVNDGSIDEGKTAETVRKFGNRVRYFEKANGGVASALNFGLTQMRGSLFSWLSHDDLYTEDKVEKQVVRYLQSPIETVVFSDFDLIDSDGNIFQDIQLSEIDPERIRFHLIHSCSFHGCAFLVPKFLIEKAGGFDETLRHVQDYDMWLKLTRYASFVRVPERLVHGRQHENQDSRAKSNQAVAECDRHFSRQLWSFANRPGVDRFQRSKEFYQLYRSHLDRGNWRTAYLSLAYAMWFAPGPGLIKRLIRRASLRLGWR